MTDLIVRNEQFNEIPVRVIKTGKGYAMPLVDIAKSIGYDVQQLTRLYGRNLELLGNNAQVVMMTSGDQVAPTGHICLDREGVNGILLRLDYHRIKDEGKKKRIVAFQKWAIETISRIVSGEAILLQKQQSPRLSVAQVVEEHLQIANAMSTHAHVDRGIATSLALALAEYKTGEDLKPWKNLIVKDRQEPAGVLTPTQIGIELGGLSAQSVNRILKRLGFQYWAGGEGGQWVLTRRGEMYAELIPITVYSKSRDLYYPRYQTKWQPRILEVLRRAFDPEMDTRQGLLSGEVNYIFPR
jgi:hypothetical protein